MILAGDVGGTKVHLALYDFIDGKLKHTRDERYPAKDFAGLEEIVRQFLGADKVSSACFGVPGPVRDGRLRLTNLPWTLDSRELSAHLGILSRAGLVKSERQGRTILYAADTDGARDLLGFLVKDCCRGQPEICKPLLG